MQLTVVVFTFVFSSIVKCWVFGERNEIMERSASNSSSSSAVVISPSEYFEGNDGPWSSFNIRVGTPEQDVRVLVSTASPESMVVLSDYGCSTSVFATVPSNCAVARGNLFNYNQSTSWENIGVFGINSDGVGLEANLGYNQRVQFGLDNLGIGLTGPSLNNQTVAGIATAEPFYLGIFGLNNQPVNFTSLGNYSSPSFLATLKDQGAIPSLSWSYTAGAQYRLKQVFGQLIFSGYDTSRFTENSVTFTMAGDVTRDLVVVLQSIAYSGSSSATLLSDPINIFIDSTDPNLWLPDTVCNAFEDAFGLTLDNTTGMYLVNDTHHTTLLNSGAEVTFRLSDVTSGGDTVRIVLPYDAFDLTAEYPLVDNTSYYFPLRRAENATQYTLGRTFLQEAYISADYERGVFNVSACAWTQGAEENIITIEPKSSDSSCTGSGCSSNSQGLSLGGGVIAGIVVGVLMIVIIVAAIVFFVLRRRKKAAYAASEPLPDEDVLIGPVHNAEPKSVPRDPVKLINQRIAAEHGLELDGHDTQIKPTTELDGKEHRIDHPQSGIRPPDRVVPIYYELAGSEVGRTESDQVSTVGTLPSRDENEDIDAPPSPFVSTLDASWQDDRRGDASSDLVSPTTPIQHRV